MRMCRCLGFTVLELMIIILIITTVFLLAIPHLQFFLIKQDRENTLYNLMLAIQLAKTEAYKHNKTIIICGSNNQRTCHHNETLGLTTGFIVKLSEQETLEQPYLNESTNRETHRDSNRDNSKNNILISFKGPVHGKLTLDFFGGNHHTIYFYPDGKTTNNGTILYCPKTKEIKEARALIINQVGRFYLSSKDAKGNLLYCR